MQSIIKNSAEYPDQERLVRALSPPTQAEYSQALSIMRKARDSIDQTMLQLGVELLVIPSDSKVNTISSAVGLSLPDCRKTCFV